MEIYFLDENGSFTLFNFFFFLAFSSLFFLSKSSIALFFLCILRSGSFFGVLEKNPTPIDKNAHMIWALLGLTYMGHPLHERETQPNNRANKKNLNCSFAWKLEVPMLIWCFSLTVTMMVFMGIFLGWRCLYIQ